MKIKKQFLQLSVFSTFLLFTACGGNSQQKTSEQNPLNNENEPMNMQDQNKSTTDMHKKHFGLANNFTHKDIVVLEHKYKLDKSSKSEMKQVINSYLQINKALFIDDENATNLAIALMTEKVGAVTAKDFKGEGLVAWENHKTLYLSKLKEMLHIKGLDNKRSYFSHISEIMYCTIKSFELDTSELYAVYCPMAFDNNGAYWISNTKNIMNPYFGAEMPKCGEIKEEL